MAEQLMPQSIPVGEEVSVPLPLPAFVTVRPKVLRSKVADTDWATSIVTVQVPVPVHAPLQPAKTESAAGVAVRVTKVPLV